MCEDDQDIAHLLQLILRQAGFDSDVAYNAQEAEEKLAQRHYNALVLDLMLPDRDGVSFIQELRQRPQTATLSIVVVSAVADERRAHPRGCGLGGGLD
ncbi:response regulator transcription factor [Deinococcus malanensis]|uniref:response regulator transcription factor n=1 Tax=Deinococcus malanensis TaxID=1706855 RepID=UPI003629EFE9